MSEFHDDFVPIPAWHTVIVGYQISLFLYFVIVCVLHSINCYDNFELTKCEILSEEYEGVGDKEVATVKFVANMVQSDSRERTSFMEASTFERAGTQIRNGAWLYKHGVISDPPD